MADIAASVFDTKWGNRVMVCKEKCACCKQCRRSATVLLVDDLTCLHQRLSHALGQFAIHCVKLLSSSLQLKLQTCSGNFILLAMDGHQAQEAPQLSQTEITLDATHMQSRTTCCHSTLSQLCNKVSARDFEQGCCSHRSKALHTSYLGIAALFAWHDLTDFPNTSVCFLILFVPSQH